MTDIDDLDVALAVARDNAAAGLPENAATVLDTLVGRTGWAGPAIVRAARQLRDGAGPVDWEAVREEYLQAVVNVTVVRAEERAAAEGEGLAKVNNNRRDKAADRRDEVRPLAARGLSAEQIRHTLERQGSSYPLRTIQRDMKKIRDG